MVRRSLSEALTKYQKKPSFPLVCRRFCGMIRGRGGALNRPVCVHSVILAGEALMQDAAIRRRSVLFVFLASVCFSTGGLFIKLVPWSALAINEIGRAHV